MLAEDGPGGLGLPAVGLGGKGLLPLILLSKVFGTNQLYRNPVFSKVLDPVRF